MARTNTIQVLRASAWDTSENPGANTLKEGEFAWNNKGVLATSAAAYTGVLWMGRKTNTNGTTENVQIYPPTFETLAHDTDATVFSSVHEQTLTIGASGTTVKIPGNLTVEGATTAVETTNLEINDKLIELGKGTDTTANADGTGLFFAPTGGSETGGYFKYVHSNTAWTSDINITAPNLTPITGTAGGVMADADAVKFASISTGAEVNVQSDWDQTTTTDDAYIANKPTVAYESAISEITATAGGLMSNADAVKFASVATGAEVNVQSDWNSTSGDSKILNKPTVAYTSAISEITATAGGLMSNADAVKFASVSTGAEVNIQSDWDQTTDTADDYIANKPTVAYESAIAEITATAGGLMSNADAVKFAGISTDADVNEVTLTGTETLTNKTIDCGTF